MRLRRSRSRPTACSTGWAGPPSMAAWFLRATAATSTEIYASFRIEYVRIDDRHHTPKAGRAGGDAGVCGSPKNGVGFFGPGTGAAPAFRGRLADRGTGDWRLRSRTSDWVSVGVRRISQG